MEKRIDLHIHTTASDGTESPAAAVALAKELGLAAVAVTDHDTVSGLAQALAAGEALGVEVVPGIELAAGYEGREIHILGYFIDPGSDALRQATDWSLRSRARRNGAMIAAMAADGMDISMEALAAAYPGQTLGRPHIADWLAKKGYAADMWDAFDRLLDKGRPYYRPREKLTLDQAARAILAAGGVAGVAHPTKYGLDRDGRMTLLARARDAGCRAVEAYYSEYSPAQQAELLTAAGALGMVPSGGSDWHGGRKPRIRMGSGIDGSLTVPYAVLDGLRALRR